MKIQVIVNARSGRGVFEKNLETILGRLLLEGTAESIRVSATTGPGSARETAASLTADGCDLVIGCGGDGTINEIIHGLMETGSSVPLAILAAGTTNDFAYSLRLPQDPDGFCRMVRAGESCLVDVGLANGRYFINVAAFGMFTEIAHTTQQASKNDLGRLAYYLNGLKSAPAQLAKHIPVRIESEEYRLEEGEIKICLIANSMSVGSIRRLMYKAQVSDGKFDVLLIRSRPVLPKDKDPVQYVLSGEFLSDPAIHYFQTDHIRIDSPIGEQVPLDLDGEFCGHLPLEVRVCPQALRVMIPPPETRSPAGLLD